MKSHIRLTLLFLAGQLGAGALPSESVAVRHREGLVRGFLVLRSLDGVLLANGDLIQSARGDVVTSRLVFDFKDGSRQEETAIYSERGRFQLLSDHFIQRGPSFPQPLEVSIDAKNGRVTVRYREDGKDKFIEERKQLPSDLANGMTLTLLKNVASDGPPTTVSMLFATPKPRLVKLVITRAGEESFSVGTASHKAVRFNVKVEIGGLPGVIAPLIGKQPHDTAVWILPGEAPAFVKSEGPFYQGGPIWRIELASPVWPGR